MTRWFTPARIGALVLSGLAVLAAVAGGVEAFAQRYDAELAMLMLTLVGLIWYTAFTYESLSHSAKYERERRAADERERRHAAVLIQHELTPIAGFFATLLKEAKSTDTQLDQGHLTEKLESVRKTLARVLNQAVIADRGDYPFVERAMDLDVLASKIYSDPSEESASSALVLAMALAVDARHLAKTGSVPSPPTDPEELPGRDSPGGEVFRTLTHA